MSRLILHASTWAEAPTPANSLKAARARLNLSDDVSESWKKPHGEHVERGMILAGAPRRRRRRLRILQVVPTVEQEASGPSYSVPRLCAALGHAGNHVVLASVGDIVGRGRADLYTHFAAPRGFRNVPLLKDLWFSASLRQQLMREAGRVDSRP